MSWVSNAWDWYVKPENREALKPFLTLLGSLVVGVGTITVGGLVARAALRQARTAIEQAKTASEVTQIASRRHDEQTRADRARRVTDTFSKAVEQLGSEKMEVRVGGIYTLERLASEALTTPQAADATGDGSTDLYWTVMETLTAFVRERARWQEPKATTAGMADKSAYLWGADTRSEDAADAAPRPTPPTDIAAVLGVIGRRPAAGREREKLRYWSLDLRMTDLRDAELLGAHLERANLFRAHLERARLAGAHLEGAKLSEAHLEGAHLWGAQLAGANFVQAHLEGAGLIEAHLERANLFEAHLEGADLRRAAGLTQAQIDEAFGDAETELPVGLNRPARWTAATGGGPAPAPALSGSPPEAPDLP